LDFRVSRIQISATDHPTKTRVLSQIAIGARRGADIERMRSGEKKGRRRVDTPAAEGGTLLPGEDLPAEA
jgi:hypothetical protein